MRLAAEAGFEAVSLWWEEEDARRRELRHRTPGLAREAGLFVDSVHAPYRWANGLWDPREGQEALALHLKWIGHCARHGVPRLIVHNSLGDEPPPVSPYGLDNHRRLASAAAEQGVTLAIENTRSDAHIRAVLEEIPTVGLCYDVSHEALYGELGALPARWGDRVVTTHFADTDGRMDRHWLPGEGAIDYGRVARAMDWTRYEGVVLLEVTAGRQEVTTERFLERAFGAAQRLRGLLGMEA
jgi:sugar phosphate isomerase/epimerase